MGFHGGSLLCGTDIRHENLTAPTSADGKPAAPFSVGPDNRAQTHGLACSILLLGVVVLATPPANSEPHRAVHVGHDGVGHGSPLLLLAVASGIAAVAGTVVTIFSNLNVDPEGAPRLLSPRQ